MQPAMDIGVFVRISTLDGAEYDFRLLRRGAVIKVDERFAMHFLRKDGEVGADRLHIEGRLERLEIL